MEWLNTFNQPPVIIVAGRELPLSIKRHRTAKRLILRLAPDGSEVRVTIPRWGQTRDALAFAKSRQAWLEQQLVSIPRHDPDKVLRSVSFRGTRMPIDWDRSYPRRPVVDDGSLLVGGPGDSAPKRIERWLRDEALQIMGSDLAHYCRRAGVTAPAIGLSRAQRRWGSCSTSGMVRINWRLIMAPDHVRRSVVAHEVAHLVHFDHSPAFYALLQDIFCEDTGAGQPDELRRADAWLKRNGRSLYVDFG